ncbi:MAG: DUF6089 family protein, partial [Ginsengibacter sp.]
FAQAPFSGSGAFRKFTIGVNAGVMNPSVVFGGSNDFANPKYSLGYGANLRYQFNHYLAVQADYMGGNLKGDQDDKFGVGRPVSSFETDLHYAVSLSGVFTFGNINFLSPKNKVLPYVSAGLGFLGYDTKVVNAGTTNQVDFVDNNSPERPRFVPVGAGLKFNLSSLINLDLGYRMNFVDADNLDGLVYWQSPPSFRSRVHKDKFSYGFVGLEFALGNQSKPQLLFDNPVSRLNDHLQTQIDTLASKLSVVDSDGDGVADQFDKEPNTPAGCPVDFRGITKDTDGDGVPDCKDKQLITPTDCQPVDADGVGKCPDPECCKNMMDSSMMNACQIGDLPSISFRGTSRTLSSDAKAMLATVASKLKGNPACNIDIIGYPAASKASQAMCTRRLDAIKTYLLETEGISTERINTNCEVGGGDANTVDIKSAN